MSTNEDLKADKNDHLKAGPLGKRLNMATGSIYKLAKSGQIPSYRCGPKLHGLRFNLDEVKAALKRPVQAA